MGATINNAIYSVTAFYQEDATKGRAKELVKELSSAERELVISILNKTMDPTTDCQPLTDKLIAIRTKDTTDAFIPITHEKDKDRSSCGKTLMNVWRAIKDFFDTRISDKTLIKEINAFSMQAALAELDELDSLYKAADKSVPEIFMPLRFETLLSDKAFYKTDLTMTKFGSIFKDDFSTLRTNTAHQLIAALAKDNMDERRELLDNYILLLKENDFKNEFSTIFSDSQPQTIETILDKITEIGEENLTQPQLSAASLYLYLFWDAYNRGGNSNINL